MTSTSNCLDIRALQQSCYAGACRVCDCSCGQLQCTSAKRPSAEMGLEECEQILVLHDKRAVCRCRDTDSVQNPGSRKQNCWDSRCSVLMSATCRRAGWQCSHGPGLGAAPAWAHVSREGGSTAQAQPVRRLSRRVRQPWRGPRRGTSSLTTGAAPAGQPDFVPALVKERT